MKVIAHDGFFKSFKHNVIDITKPWKWVFWTHIYYDLKWNIWALIKYFKIVITMRPWDSHHVITMMKFQIEILANNIEKYGHEVDESRLPKIQKMRRFIELANNYLEENYLDRCGYIDRDFEFVPVEEEKNLYEWKSKETPEEQEHNKKVFEKAHELEEKEWNEMIEILKEMRGWWD